MNADELKIVLTYIENSYKQHQLVFSPAMQDLWLEDLAPIPFDVVKGSARHWVEYRPDEPPGLFDLLIIIEHGRPGRYPINLFNTDASTWIRDHLYKGWDYDSDIFNEEFQKEEE